MPRPNSTDDRVLDLSSDLVAQSVRFPKEIHERLRRLADDQDRSFSAQIVWACRRYFDEMDRPSQAELETPGLGEAPAFVLVPRWQGEAHPPPGSTSPPDSFAIEVEGRVVPNLTVTEPQTSDGDYWLALDDRFGIAAHTYEELWRWGWFVAHAMAIGEGRASHAFPSRLRQLVDEGWKITDDAGMGGATYEMTLTFALPGMADGDEWAYEARDAAITQLSAAGARDVVTRLITLGPLAADRRDRTQLELEEIEGYGPISQVLTIQSAVHDDGTDETTTIEIGVGRVETDDAVPG